MGVAKAALESVSRYLARDLGPQGIRVNLVSAGPLGTVAARGIPGFEQLAELWRAQAPLGWDIEDPAPVAAAICFLLSDYARAITGEILHVDGGFPRASAARRAESVAARPPGAPLTTPGRRWSGSAGQRAQRAGLCACSARSRSRSRASSSGSATPRRRPPRSSAAPTRCRCSALLAWREDRRLGRRAWRDRRIAIAAGVFFAADLILWHHSIGDVGAGLATVLANIQVVLVPLVAWAVLAERPGGRCSPRCRSRCSGVLLISGVLEHGAYGRDPARGTLFGLGAGIAYVGFLLLLRRGGADLRRPAGPLFDATATAAVLCVIVGRDHRRRPPRSELAGRRLADRRSRSPRRCSAGC